MKVATDWAHLPAVGAAPFLEGALEGLVEPKGKSGLASVVDGTQPIDFAATVEPKVGATPLFAVALGMKSLDAARGALGASFDFTPADNGVLRMEPHGDVREEGKKGGDSELRCELAPSVGGSPFRLVCASSHEALTSLAPYLTRTTPRKTIAADAHLEFHADPVKGLATVGRMQGPAILSAILGLSSVDDPAAVELLNAVIGDVFDYTADLDGMSLDASLDPAQGTLTYRTTFKSSGSLMARLATAHPERADVPPGAFSRLPADADFAFFGGGIDDADLLHPRDVLVAAAREQLRKVKLPEADRRALTELLKECVRGSRGMVIHGSADAAGYWLFESEDAGDRADKTVRDVVGVLGRAAIATWVKSGLPATAKLPTWLIAPPFAGLPKGSLHVEVTLFPDAPPPKGPKPTAAKPSKPATASLPHAAPAVYHLVVAPDGPRSWIAVSSSEALIRVKLAALVGAARAADPTSFPELQGWRETRMTSGGFFTVRSLVSIVRESLSGHRPAAGETRLLARIDDILRRLPANGTTPILVSAAPGAPTADDPGGSDQVEMTLPADAVRDAVWLGMQMNAK